MPSVWNHGVRKRGGSNSAVTGVVVSHAVYRHEAEDGEHKKQIVPLLTLHGEIDWRIKIDNIPWRYKYVGGVDTDRVEGMIMERTLSSRRCSWGYSCGRTTYDYGNIYESAWKVTVHASM